MKRQQKIHCLITLVVFLLSSCSVFHQKNKAPGSYSFQQLKTDKLFESKQIISIFSLPLGHDSNYSVQLAYSQGELKPTSSFAKENDAVAAINAGFFDMKKGGSVSYLEVNDLVIAHAGPLNRPDSLLNGVIMLLKNNKVIFEHIRPDSLYMNSTLERAVLGTGPLLLLDSKKVTIPKNPKFAANKHPRTCMCSTANALLLITVDGRSKQAHGMSLYELQDFLLSQGCIEGINLDGGGSTTMWIKDRGVVNNPSDKTGERKVANAILVK